MPKAKVTKNNFLNPETGRVSITDAFGENLAGLLAEKLLIVDKTFPRKE